MSGELWLNDCDRERVDNLTCVIDNLAKVISNTQSKEKTVSDLASSLELIQNQGRVGNLKLIVNPMLKDDVVMVSSALYHNLQGSLTKERG